MSVCSQAELLERIIEALEISPEAHAVAITDEKRKKLAEVVRSHYRKHGRTAMAMQAEMDMPRWATRMDAIRSELK